MTRPSLSRTTERRDPLPLRRIFAVPLAIALLTLVGLVTALTGEGWRDLLSWLALASPVAALLWAARTRRS
jgi:hypothetical protein